MVSTRCSILPNGSPYRVTSLSACTRGSSDLIAAEQVSYRQLLDDVGGAHDGRRLKCEHGLIPLRQPFVSCELTGTMQNSP